VPDGSLRIYFGKDSPARATGNNWLPAPEGAFLYGDALVLSEDRTAVDSASGRSDVAARDLCDDDIERIPERIGALRAERKASGPADATVRNGCAPCIGVAFYWVRLPPGNGSSRTQPEPLGGEEPAAAFGMRVTTYRDSTSVRTETRVNTQQSSKRTMHRPTPSPLRGRLMPPSG